MNGGPLTNGFLANRASSLASGTISVCGVGFASDHPQNEHDQGKSPRRNFLPAASRIKTRSPSRRASSASCTSKRRQMSEMMCSICGLGAASGTVGQDAAAFEEFDGSTDDSDDADESELPLPLLVLPPLILASASPGHRASPQSLRSSATRSALQGGRCGLLEGEKRFFF